MPSALCDRAFDSLHELTQGNGRAFCDRRGGSDGGAAALHPAVAPSSVAEGPAQSSASRCAHVRCHRDRLDPGRGDGSDATVYLGEFLCCLVSAVVQYTFPAAAAIHDLAAEHSSTKEFLHRCSLLVRSV